MSTIIDKIITEKLDTHKMWVAYAMSALGCFVYPCGAGTKIPVKGSKGIHSASGATDQLEEWLGRYRNCNFGYALEPSRICTLDVDMHGADGIASLQRMVDDNIVTMKDLKSALIQSTPRGGFHFIYRIEPSMMFKAIHCKADDPRTSKYVGIDILSKGCSTICAGSETPDGKYNICNRYLSDLPYVPYSLYFYCKNVHEQAKTYKIIAQRTKKVGNFHLTTGNGRNVCLTSRAGAYIRTNPRCDLVQLVSFINSINVQFPEPLPANEIGTIAQSVFKYRDRK